MSTNSKIICWIKADLIFFGVSKFLQEKHDCELYAIFDITNRPKQFFQNQQLVHFKKIWFFHDYVSKTKKKPDLEYLSSFEKKYKINLWLIAQNERLFYDYNEYYKFSVDEILLLLEQECKLFESILDEVKPDFLFTSVTDLQNNHIFYELCKARGITTLILRFTPFGFRGIISSEMNKIDCIENYSNNTGPTRSFEELQNYLKDVNALKKVKQYVSETQSSRWDRLKAAVQYLIFSGNTNIKTHYSYYGRTRLRVILKEIIYYLRTKYRGLFMDRHFVRHIDSKTPFIYFPLHENMDRVLLLGAPFYTNEVEVIKNIVRSLPVGYKLYVKEHPIMYVRGWRKVSIYKQIMQLPHVKLIHPSVNSDEIIKNCSLVISISGTSALEAAFYNKPSIIFTKPDYSFISSVRQLLRIDELPELIRSSLQTKADLAGLNKYVNTINENSIEFDLVSYYLEVQNNFYLGGNLADVKISISQMESFLNKEASVFEKLAREFKKKMSKYKEIESKRLH